MNYFIDPAVFYWANTYGSIRAICFLLGALSVIAGLFFTFEHMVYIEKIGDLNQEYSKKGVYLEILSECKFAKKMLLIAYIVGVILIAGGIFIPSKQTSVEMIVCRTVTVENVNMTVEQMKDLIDYIVKAIRSVV